jgi:hypothetical protein
MATARGAWICCADESGLNLIPPVRTTWAPRGQTPILHHHWRRGDQLSMAAFICYHPDGRRVRLLTDHTTGAYNTDKLITALQRLPTLLDRAPVILIWDGLPAHRSIDMKAWLAAQTGWLHVVALPGYAPELNPVEMCLSQTEGCRACPAW